MDYDALYAAQLKEEEDEQLELLADLEQGRKVVKQLYKPKENQPKENVQESKDNLGEKQEEKSSNRKHVLAHAFDDDDDDDGDMDEEYYMQQQAAAQRKRIKRITPEIVTKRQPVGKHLSVTLANGNRVYMRGSRKHNKVNVGNGNLLKQPIRTLIRKLSSLKQGEVLRRTKENSDKLARIDRLMNGQMDEDDDDEGFLPDVPQIVDSKLWVDEYAATRYTDLVSDEETNKMVLRWLKSWNKVVFGIDGPKAYGEKEYNFDSKVLLLSGPPGVGKTTLAHIVAKHCGYHCVEVNSSDERSAQTIKERIATATQNQEVLSVDRRPNCLILDEIDGAPKAAIAQLLRAVKQESKKGSSIKALRRPIICICNDISAPALKPLKMIAYHVECGPIDSNALVARLGQICRQKHVSAERHALLSLCDLMSGDCRACISTLQFATSKDKRFTSDKSVQAIGGKDQVISLKGVWKEVFRKPRRQLTGARQSYRSPVENVMRSVSSNGDYDMIVQGCFENFLSMKGTGSFDPRLEKAATIHEWNNFYVMMNEQIQTTQIYALMGYLSYVPAAYHSLYASSESPPTRWPRSFFEEFQQSKVSNNIITEMLDHMSPKIRRQLYRRELILDSLSPLIKSICPTVRVVSAAMLTQEERDKISDVAKTMSAYNLSFRQTRLPTGQYDYILTPPIDKLVQFSASPEFCKTESKPWKDKSFQEIPKSLPGLPYAVKQMIALQVASESMKTLELDDKSKAPAAANPSEATAVSSEPVDPMNIDGSQRPKKTEEEKAAFMKARMGIQMTSSSAAKRTRENHVHRDFFGRTMEAKSKKLKKKPGASKPESDPTPCVSYKFNEGCSNAVRRTLRLRDLI